MFVWFGYFEHAGALEEHRVIRPVVRPARPGSHHAEVCHYSPAASFISLPGSYHS